MASFISNGKRSALSVLALGMVAASSSAFAGGNNWNPEHILNVLKNPYQTRNSQGTTVVIAHRGVTAPGCPENSRCSILNTYNSGVEAIELDVKQSAQGTPWLFHDQNAGRMLSHNPEFNIYVNGGWNPDIGAMSDRDLSQSFLRDKDFKVTGYHPMEVWRALDTVKNQANHMVIVFDIKTLDAVSRIADMVNARHMQNQVVLKFSASLIAANPRGVTSYTKGVAFAPTIYTSDMDHIIDSRFAGTCGLAGSFKCRIESWVDIVSANTNFAWVEVGNKNPVWADPTYPLVDYLRQKSRAMGAFSPVPEYRTNAGDGAYFIRSDGHCCAKLSDYLTKSKYFNNETYDGREDVGAQIAHGFTSVISDRPSDVINASERFRSRNTAAYF